MNQDHLSNLKSIPNLFSFQNGDRMSRGLKLLGVCAWGYIKDNDLFVNPDPNKFNKVRYNSNKEIRRGDNVPLNGDHTHFLMVDDSARYKMLSGYTEFITRYAVELSDGTLSLVYVGLANEG